MIRIRSGTKSREQNAKPSSNKEGVLRFRALEPASVADATGADNDADAADAMLGQVMPPWQTAWSHTAMQ